MTEVASWISPRAAKGRPSGIAGRGLRAVQPIARDEIVAVKGGHVVDGARLAELPERLRNSDIQIADDLHLVALAEDEYEPVMLFRPTARRPPRSPVRQLRTNPADRCGPGGRRGRRRPGARLHLARLRQAVHHRARQRRTAP